MFALDLGKEKKLLYHDMMHRIHAGILTKT